VAVVSTGWKKRELTSYSERACEESLLQNVQAGSGIHPRFYLVGVGALYPGSTAVCALSGTLTARSRNGQTLVLYVPALYAVRLGLHGFHKDNLAFNFY